MEESIKKESKFKQYYQNEIKNKKVLKLLSHFIIASGEIESREVLLVTIRHYELKENYFESLLNNSKLFKFKSKYLLKKLGYSVDSSTKALTMIYQKSPGKVFQFQYLKSSITSNNTINKFSNVEIKKLFFLDKILNIIQRLKGGNLSLGTLDPSLFIFNPGSETPLILIDYAFFPIIGSIQNPNLKISFGIFDFQENRPNDYAMALILLTEVFLEEENAKKVFPFQKLIYNFYREYIGIGDDFSEIIENHVNSQNSSQIKKFILKHLSLLKMNRNKNKDKNLESILEDEKLKFSEFYLDFTENILKPKFRQSKCADCNNTADKIHNVCFEFLCSTCFSAHSCIDTKCCETDKITHLVKTYSDTFTLNKNKFSACPSSALGDNYTNLFKKSISPCFDMVNTSSNELDIKIGMKLDHIHNLFILHSKLVKNVLKEKVENLNKKILEFKRKLHHEEEVEEDIENVENYVKVIKDKLTLINNKLNVADNLKQMTEISLNYKKILNIFVRDILMPVYSEANSTTFDKINLFDLDLMKSNSEHEYILLDQLCNNYNNNKSEFYFPEFNTSKLTKFSDIQPDGTYKSTEIEILFVNENEENVIGLNKLTEESQEDSFAGYFPKNSKWLYTGNFLIFTGGCCKPTYKLPTASVILVILATNKAYLKSSMLIPRHSHAVCNFNKVFIIAVGGDGTKTCEIMSLLKNQWYKMPSLNSERINSSLFVFNDNILYCFGGVNCNTIEWLDLALAFEKEFVSGKWNIISLRTDDNFYSLSDFGILPLSSNHILLLGGRKLNKEEGLSDKIYSFDFTNNLFLSNSNVKLPFPCFFPATHITENLIAVCQTEDALKLLIDHLNI